MVQIRDNEFHVKGTSVAMANWGKFEIGGLSFEMQSYAITPGQPFDGISSISCDSGKWTIHVQAGRKGSKSVADWFKEKVAGGASRGGLSGPHELNFAFIGRLTFWHNGNTYGGDNVVIGQGHSGVDNNWWVGGPNMTSAGDDTGNIHIMKQRFFVYFKDKVRDVVVYFYLESPNDLCIRL